MPSAFPSARMLVPRPTRITSPYGLFSVAQLPTESDGHWQLGVRTEIGTCLPSGVTTDSCAVTGTGNKVQIDAMSTLGATPFTVYSIPACSTVGFVDEARKYATDALINGEQRAVEREFWSGAAGTTPHLAANTQIISADGSIEQSAATTVVSGGASVDPVEGLGLLEEALGWCYGAEGVIHAPPSVVTSWEARGLVRRVGSSLRSPGNHLIARGDGYPGTGPDGSMPATSRWVYATGAVQLRRGPIEVRGSSSGEVVDRSKNDVVLVAERTYVINWECCHLAIPIKIGGIAADTSGT